MSERTEASFVLLGVCWALIAITAPFLPSTYWGWLEEWSEWVVDVIRGILT